VTSAVSLAVILLANVSPLAGQSEPVSEDEAQRTAGACVIQFATRWSVLSDSASDIAEAALFSCRSEIDKIWPLGEKELIKQKMDSGASLQDVNKIVYEYRNNLLEFYRKGAITLVVEQRYEKAFGVTK
jgi:hypothetical protein